MTVGSRRTPLPQLPLGLLVRPGDEVLELGPLDAPLTASADFEGGEVAAADQGDDLGVGRRQFLGDLADGEEAAGVWHGEQATRWEGLARSVPA